MATTVASATRSPRARQRSIVSASSRTRPGYRARARCSRSSGRGAGEGRRGRRAVPVEARSRGSLQRSGSLPLTRSSMCCWRSASMLLLHRRREPARLDGRVQVRLGVLDHRVLQAVDGLALRLRDLGEGLAALEPAVQLVLGQAEVARGRVEPVDEPVRPAGAVAEAGRPEEREVVGLDPLLELVALLLRQPAGGDGRVDPVLVRLLQRRAELARLDAQGLGGVVRRSPCSPRSESSSTASSPRLRLRRRRPPARPRLLRSPFVSVPLRAPFGRS